jgi:hypothetical protein
MQKKRLALKIVLIVIGIMIAVPPNIFGTEVKSPPLPGRFSRNELSQMLSPIALYPEPVLSQILMAAIYPVEIVAADRWVKETTNLTNDAFNAALKNKKWDESVKALARNPRVLSMMAEKIEWTTRLGNAFLNQKNDVRDNIQELRADAEAAAGNPKPPAPGPSVVYAPYPPPPPVYPVMVTREKVPPSFPSILCDLIFLRPIGFALLGLGMAATLVATPFALPTGTMGQVSQELIGGPFDFTFVRPLGTWETWAVRPAE